MVPEYINTEEEVATKGINSLTRVRNQILTKEGMALPSDVLSLSLKRVTT